MVEVAVVGVNKEAVEEAEILTKFASTVHWITPIDPKPDDAHAQALQLVERESDPQPWQRAPLSSCSPPAPPQGAPGGSGQLATPRVRRL